MNLSKKCVLSAILLMGILGQTIAQNTSPIPSEPDLNKPSLFSDLPDSVLIDASRLSGLVALASGSVVRVDLAPNLLLQGTVVSVAQSQNPPLNSVVVKLSNRLGAVFTLTRILEEGEKPVFQGRILSRRHIDAFELVATQNSYYLVKRSYYDLSDE